MKGNIAAAAKMLEISEPELFRRAYNTCGGHMFALRSPEEMHRRWTAGLCVTPIYVVSFVNNLAVTMRQQSV